jgi:aromatic ring-opening dioxygenase catalytic subunit (LigB family)
MLQPAIYIPHGGGPCFFMEAPEGHWSGMAAFLSQLPATLPQKPRAILIVSGHWETSGFSLTAHPSPPLLYDYYGFPAHTYQIRYDAPGDPELALSIRHRLQAAGFSCELNTERGLDHGVFVPLKVALPNADIPIVELSLDRSLEPALHLSVGRALTGLRAENVLLLGSGMSFHNLRAFGDPRASAVSLEFDSWLQQAVALPGAARAHQLARWHEAPAARLAHPRPEHLLPLMVAAGSSEQIGTCIYNEPVLGATISGFRFD